MAVTDKAGLIGLGSKSFEEIMKDYLGPTVEDEEIRAIGLQATAKRIRDLKMAVAESIIASRESFQLDQIENSRNILKQAKELKERLLLAYGEWRRLGGEEVKGSNGAKEAVEVK